jgi:hypothetical protein
MFVTVITDCFDPNAASRQVTRYQSYLGLPTFLVGVNMPTTNIDISPNHGELEAAFQMIDNLDAAEGSKGVIVANVAPRQGKAKKWPNGTPFGYFHYKNTLVLSSIDGLTLSLVKKLGLVDHINMFDIPTVIRAMIDAGHLEEWHFEHITKSQFRSFEFLPRAAKWLSQGFDLPTEKYSISEISDAPKAIGYIDNFGNTVTTMLPEDIDFEPGKKLQTKYGEFTCYERLKDVPNGETALIIGSWGLDKRRWISFITQGKSTAELYKVKVGDTLFE